MFNQEEEMEQGVKTTVLSLKDLKMEVIINNRFKEFSFDSNVRGFYVYKNIWNPRIGKDCLKWQYESGNNNDKFAIGVYQNDKMKEKIVGHVPLYLSKAMFQFIQLLQSKLPCTVKGKQVNRGAASAPLLKIILLHGCFSCFLNCTNGTKLRKTSQLEYPLIECPLFGEFCVNT